MRFHFLRPSLIGPVLFVLLLFSAATASAANRPHPTLNLLAVGGPSQHKVVHVSVWSNGLLVSSDRKDTHP